MVSPVGFVIFGAAGAPRRCKGKPFRARSSLIARLPREDILDHGDLDPFDRRILREVQRDARATATALSEAVGLSPSACHRRLQSLRARGVIQAEVAVVDPRAVGRRVTLIVAVTLEREQSDVITEFKRACRDTAEVMQCYYVTGPADFVMVLTARSMEAYDAFVERFLFANRNVRRFETMVVMDRVKVGFEVPMDGD